jgi:hypothetical protein
MPRYMLSVPPPVYQTALYCWAAGASSWLRAMKRGVATPQQLIVRFGKFLNDDGTLPESSAPDDAGVEPGGMTEVFRQLRIHLTSIPRSTFTYDYVLDKLKRKGHLLLLEQAGGDMGHTNVVYGVGVPGDGYFSVFDPLKGRGGHRNRRFADVGGGTVIVGWTALAGPT